MRRLCLALVLAPALLFAGCSTNPATGKSQLNIYSESQEVQMGQAADRDIVTQYGLYDDAELAEYVNRVGQDLAARSERPNLPWTFRVLDDPVINAFALPGGYIYVTRGILAHMSSESELAAVLGHEVGHVTARHGVNRMTKAQMAQIGLVAGTVLAPEMARAYGGLAQSSMQLLFLKYGRDDERQADSLGHRYGDLVGFNPNGAVDVFGMLAATGELAGGNRLPGYLSTHPDPLARQAEARQRVSQSSPDALESPLGREPFLARIDGVPFGADPNQGFFVGRAFVHPELDLQIMLPEGWKGYNQKQALVAISPQQDAMMQLTLTGQNTVNEAANAFYGQQGLSVRGSWRADRPIEATRQFVAGDNTNQTYGMAGFAEYGGRVYRLMGLTKPNAWNGRSRDLEGAIDSFGRLENRRYLDVDPMRVNIVTLDRAMTLTEFDRRYPSTVDLKRLAVLNHVAADEMLERGTKVKRVTGFDPGPQMDVLLSD